MMTNVLERYTRKPWQISLWAFFFTMPVWSSLLGRLVKGKWWFNDFDALICGADHLRRGLSPYSLAPVCEGLNPAPYVYAPQIGQAFAPLLEMLGFSGLKALYALALLAVLGFSFWFILIRKWPRVPLVWRLLGFGVLTGSSIASGNIGLMLHGLILIAALNLHRSLIPFVIIVLLAACIKPFLLTYMIVLMFTEQPFRARLVQTAAATMVGAALVAALFLNAPYAAEWSALRDSIVAQEQSGMSWFSWINALGFNTYSPLSLGGLVIYLALTSLCGLIIAERSGADRTERIIIGLTFALLLNPRLMDYDLLLMPLGMAVIVALSASAGTKPFRLISLSYLALSALCLVLRMADISGYAPDSVAVLAYVLLAYTLAFLQRRQSFIIPPSR